MNTIKNILLLIISSITLLGCTVKELPSPKLNNNNIINSMHAEVSVIEDYNHLFNAIIQVCGNDTIYKEIYRLSGNGLDNYYWVPFIVVDSILNKKYDINFGERLNNAINISKSTNNIKYYPDILKNATENGFNPHLSVPRLDLLTNKDQESTYILDLNTNDIKDLEKPYFAKYIESDNQNLELDVFAFEDNEIKRSSISKTLIGTKPIIYLAYNIIEPCDANDCNELFPGKVINCIFYQPFCKVCENVFNHDPTINTESNLGGWTGAELQIHLNNPNYNHGGSLESYYPCYNQELFNINIDLANRSFGNLSSVPSCTYYHNIKTPGTSNFKLNTTNKPIKAYQYNPNGTIYKLEEVNAISLCNLINYFYAYGDGSSSGEALAGGLYRIKRLNGLPLYFYFPVHVFGGLMHSDNADNMVLYNLTNNNQNSLCDNLSAEFAVQEDFKINSACRYCVENLLGLGMEYFINTDINFLKNYWEKEEIILYVTDSKRPGPNNIKTYTGTNSNTNCNLTIPPNAIKVAELNKTGTTIDQYVEFNNNNKYPNNTNFIYKVDVLFGSGKQIHACDYVVGQIITQNNLLEGVGLFPRGKITSLHIEIYKI